MGQLKEVYPEFAEDVAFYAVGAHFGIEADIETQTETSEKRGYPWPVATSSFRMLADFNVTLHSTKIAFDSLGMIAYRGELGRGDAGQWQRLGDGSLRNLGRGSVRSSPGLCHERVNRPA